MIASLGPFQVHWMSDFTPYTQSQSLRTNIQPPEEINLYLQGLFSNLKKKTIAKRSKIYLVKEKEKYFIISKITKIQVLALES